MLNVIYIPLRGKRKYEVITSYKRKLGWKVSSSRVRYKMSEIKVITDIDIQELSWPRVSYLSFDCERKYTRKTYTLRRWCLINIPSSLARSIQKRSKWQGYTGTVLWFLRNAYTLYTAHFLRLPHWFVVNRHKRSYNHQAAWVIHGETRTTVHVVTKNSKPSLKCP